jgi:glycosyltransferase EpsF
MRKQMGLSKDTLVIGNIGRLAPPKNQFYLLQVFAEMLYLKGDMILLIAGDGPLKEELISKSKSLGIADKVRFLGTRSDTENLYQTMDVFVLTSNYEGFGIVNIEAQASGLPCFISDVVPQSVKINCNVEFLSILEEPKVWAKQILNADLSRVEVTYEEFARSGFDISQTSVQLQEYYQKLLKK